MPPELGVGLIDDERCQDSRRIERNAYDRPPDEVIVRRRLVLVYIWSGTPTLQNTVLRIDCPGALPDPKT